MPPYWGGFWHVAGSAPEITRGKNTRHLRWCVGAGSKARHRLSHMLAGRAHPLVTPRFCQLLQGRVGVVVSKARGGHATHPRSALATTGGCSSGFILAVIHVATIWPGFAHTKLGVTPPLGAVMFRGYCPSPRHPCGLDMVVLSPMQSIHC